jgi:NTE family protein
VDLACAALLFDVDGVLADSDASVESAWTRWARRYGLDAATVLAVVHGRRSADTVAALIGPERRAQALADVDRYEVEDAGGVTALPGAAQLLGALPRGSWAIVTSGRRELTTARLVAAGLPCPAVLVCAEDVPAGKPDGRPGRGRGGGRGGAAGARHAGAGRRPRPGGRPLRRRRAAPAAAAPGPVTASAILRGVTTRALVLGGGGVAGIAWEIGLLAGLADAGLDVRDADLVVGTSAGSVVGTLLRTGPDLAELEARQLAPAPGEPSPRFDAAAMMTRIAEALTGVTGDQEARARVGALALDTPTVREAERRAVIGGRIGVPGWPARRLLVTAVDAADGSFAAFEAGSGVALVDAVAASCAVPLVWPPITIGGRRYIDGGMRSVTNADLATGCDRVLVVAPFVPPDSPLGPTLDQEVAGLRDGGARVEVVLADDAALQAFGTNPLDPATRAPSARAGRAQAARVLAAVRDLWG